MPYVLIPRCYRVHFWRNYPELKLQEEEVWGKLHGLPVAGHLVHLKEPLTPKGVFGEKNCLCVYQDEDLAGVTFAVPFTGADWEQLHGRVVTETEHSSKFFKPNLTSVVEKLSNLVTLLAIASDQIVTLHLPKDGSEFQVRDTPGHLHVVLNALPPGDCKTQRVSMLGDISLVQGAYTLSCCGPAKGRGITVPYDDDFTIAQIIGTTIYVFLPTHDDTLSSFITEFDYPFRVAIAYAWNAYQKNDPPLEMMGGIPVSEALWVESYSSVPGVMKETAVAEVQRYQNEIDELQARLAQTYTALRVHQNILDNAAALSATYDPVASYQVLKDCPYIESIRLSSDQVVHYHSKPVLVNDDSGQLRDLGSFVVRIRDRKAFVWAERLTHPKRVPHPHINVDGAVCYGNVSTEVSRLCGEIRNAEAVALIMQWLFEGYDATLTRYKIEEWPEARKENYGTKHESRSPVQDVRPEAATPAGHHRRRLGGKLRDLLRG